MKIYYESSEGTVLNFISEEYKMLTETDLFNTEWQYETVGTNYPYVSAFKNQMVSRAFTVMVRGSTTNALRDNVEHLMDVIDRDVRLKQVGRLYVDNYFKEGYFIATEKSKIYETTKTSIALTFLSEEGDWKSEQLSVYEGLSGGEYLNPYSVPVVSSNEENYSFGESEGVEGSVELNAQYTSYVDIGSADTFILKGYGATVQYKLPNDADWTTVSHFPYEIDVSSVPLYVNEGGRKTNARISLHSSENGTLEYETVASENSTTIDWTPSSDDDEPIFTIDLGVASQLKEIVGLDIAQGHTPVSDETVSLQVSANGVDWTTVDSETIPTSIGEVVTLNHTWTGNYPLARYIRVHSSPIGSSTTEFANYSVQSKHLKIKAHFEGENQNLALSSIFSSGDVEVEEWDLNTTLDFTLQGANSSHWFTFKLPTATTVVEIGSITLQSSENTPVYVDYVDSENISHRIGIVVATSQGTVLNFDNMELEDVTAISFDSIGAVKYTATNFKILEEQTVAPHRYVRNDNYVPSDAIITIYGATTQPTIMIGDNQYGAEDETLGSDETLVINTKDETIRHYTDGEGYTNLFYKRLDETFEKIDVGSQEIIWEGNIRVDVELLNSRSDPKWN